LIATAYRNAEGVPQSKEYCSIRKFTQDALRIMEMKPIPANCILELPMSIYKKKH
jgi:hypothetical protein